MMVEMVVWSGTRWESVGNECVCVCVCLSEEKRKKMKERKEMWGAGQKDKGMRENEWRGIVGLDGAHVV